MTTLTPKEVLDYFGPQRYADLMADVPNDQKPLPSTGPANSPTLWDLVQELKLAGCPLPEAEYRFAAPRRWRFDLAWVDRKLAVELDGGTWTNGRHTRGVGFENDCRKLAEALIRGWMVFRFTPAMVTSGEAGRYLRAMLLEER